jgi:alkyl hydroperoxide reductase subunit AhpC
VAHATTRDLRNLPFPMLADTKQELSKALGILHKTDGVCLRATFIVDPEGTIRWVEVNDLAWAAASRGAARARRPADRRALPVQLAEGRQDPLR